MPNAAASYFLRIARLTAAGASATYAPRPAGIPSGSIATTCTQLQTIRTSCIFGSFVLRCKSQRIELQRHCLARLAMPVAGRGWQAAQGLLRAQLLPELPLHYR